jgi:hypothetical protein
VYTSLTFDSLHIKSNARVNLINGYSLSDFLASVITEDYRGKIYGGKTVTESVTAESFDLKEAWNGYSFPDSFVYKTPKPIVITAKKSFANVRANEVLLLLRFLVRFSGQQWITNKIN